MGTGDFDGDRRADILWQNNSGQVSIWEMTGTNKGELFGRPPTGRKVTVSGYEVVQLKNGKMVSHYDNHGTQTVLEVLAKVGHLDAPMMKKMGFAQG